jgi:hypothetical protein
VLSTMPETRGSIGGGWEARGSLMWLLHSGGRRPARLAGEGMEKRS